MPINHMTGTANMSLQLTAFATLLTLATAQQSSVLQIPFYGYDTQTIDASIVGVSNSATTFQLACPPGTDSSDCGLFPSQTLVYGPSTYSMNLGVGSAEAFTGTQDCSPQGTTSAVCTESNGGNEANDPGMSTTSYEASDIAVLPVTVTAGGEKLGASARAGAGAGVGGVASASATATATATATGTGSATLVSGTASASSNVATASRSSAAIGTATGSSSAAVSSLKGSGPGAIAAVLAMLGWAVL